MNSDNLAPVTYADQEWARIELAFTEDEPWSWTCPSCHVVLPRDAIAAHRAVEASRRSGRIAAVCLLALALLAAGVVLGRLT